MKRMAMVLVLVVSLGLASLVQAQTKTKPFILTTVDLKEEYEIIGLVSYRSNSTNFDDLSSGLKKAGQNVGAEAIVGIDFVNYADFFYAYGTAVKFKKEK